MQATKILIITHVHSRPDFIEIHDKTFKAFLHDDYEYVVFNDAPTDEMRVKIENTCEKWGIHCVRVPQELHEGRPSPSKRHVDCIQYSLNLLGFDHNGIVLMIDSDMFLIKPFRATTYMQNYNFIGCRQERSHGDKHVVYSFPGLVFMDMRTLSNKKTIQFEDGFIEGLACDTGGHTYYYFKNNPTLNLKLYTAASTNLLPKTSTELLQFGYDEGSINFILGVPPKYGMEFHGDNNFIHYYAGGSNWPGYSADYHKEKTKILINFIDEQINIYQGKK